MRQNVTQKNDTHMINKLKNHPKYHSIVVKVISSAIFVVGFLLVGVTFELLHRGSVVNQINSLIHNILVFGLK